MTVPAITALTVVIYVLVADGLVALVLGGLLGPAAASVVGLAVVGSVWPHALGRRVQTVPWLGAALVVLATLAVTLEVVLLAPAMLDAFAHLLVLLLLIKLYTRRTLRDVRDIGFLAFFMLVAVSPATTSVVFLGLVMVFVVVGTWLLMLRHLLTEAESAAAAPSLRIGRDLAGLSVAASVATIVITAALFIIIPRVGQAALPLRPQASRMVSGFSDRVELGAFGEIEADGTVVMRVHLKDWRGGGQPEILPNLRWRGMALDAFDGRTWTVSRRTLRLTLRRRLPVPFAVHPYRGGPLLTQEIYLEPISSDVVFAAPRVLRLHGRAEFVVVDDLGNIAIPAPAARLNYTVESEPELADPHHADVVDARLPPDPRWLARYTQLPELAPRVADLAREITAGSVDDYEAATRLSEWLARNLRYTRALQRTTDLPPVEEFLFVQRSGNCEYFAAALAVMVRALGIPARVVNGFQRGEWNPYGDYFMVRLRDAHSWVEVFVRGAGWITLDPSPRIGVEAPIAAGRATLWLDSLRLSWYRYVVSWSLHDQLAAADSTRRATLTWSGMALRPRALAALPRVALGLPIVVAIVATLLVLRRRRATPERRTPAVPRFYARTLRVLARRGLAPGAGETAGEFARRAATIAGTPLIGLTQAYERVRFGGAALTPAEAADVERWLAALEKARP